MPPQQQQQSQDARAPISPQSRPERLYESEEIIQKATLIASDYKETLTDIVLQESLSQRCKLALLSVINMAFDKNVVLAWNANLEKRKLQLEEALNKAKLSYTRPDVMNPALVYIHETIRQHFADFVSRSFNLTERKMQAERRTVAGVTSSSSFDPQQSDRRGFTALEGVGSGQGNQPR